MAGYVDLCETGRFTEHGIKALDGFLREEWTDDAAGLVRVPDGLGEAAALTEPLSVVVKAVEVAEGVQARIPWFEGWRDQRVLLAGTGSLGMLAAFLFVERGARVWAMDRTGEDAFSSELLRRLGVAHFNAKETDVHEVAEEIGGFDLVVEATGVPQVVFDTVLTLDANGVMVMLGVPLEKDAIPIEADDVMRRMVLNNQALVGSVNSNRGHFEQALSALQRWRTRWGDTLDSVITHRYAPEEIEEAFRADEKDLVKKVVDWR